MTFRSSLREVLPTGLHMMSRRYLVVTEVAELALGSWVDLEPDPANGMAERPERMTGRGIDE